MSDQTYLLILRLLHIGCGVFWAGTAIYAAFFLEPAVHALGADGTKFMQQLVRTNRFPVVILLSAMITVVAGALLIWKLSGGLQTQWLSTLYGTVLTGGATLAIIAFLIGFSISRPASMRIAKIGQAIAVAGGPPTAAQIQELQMLGKRLSIAGRVIAVLLIFAVIGMSVFRYA
ncbi:MAG TPA: hypothetical protein VGQ53_15790 [Chitinophagaceae bacterium]|jgi:uncharacterized membrane protein|nr:hypothetical protein [Chitinophagaceae bacterium]